MKRKMIIILLIVTIMTTGCGANVEKIETSPETSMFVMVEEADNWCVVYHKNTKVMYEVSRGIYNRGTFTLLVGDDGKPMLWEDE